MAQEYGRSPNLADFIPQSVIVSPAYELRVATFPAARFVATAPIRPETRAMLPASPVREPAIPELSRGLRRTCLVVGLLLVGLCCASVPLLVGWQ